MLCQRMSAVDIAVDLRTVVGNIELNLSFGVGVEKIRLAVFGGIGNKRRRNKRSPLHRHLALKIG